MRALVTGATNGIGTEIARGLAAAGYTVLVHGRNAAKAEATCRDITVSTGNPNVQPVLADFDSLASVRELAARLKAAGEPLDVLVSNAGVVTLKREETADGFERMYGVNFLASFLLVRELLPLVKQGSGKRVVIVASEAHRFVKDMRWDDLAWHNGFKAMKTYGHSKLGNLLFAKALAAREQALTVWVAHPGAVATGLGAQNGWLGKWMTRLLKPFFRSPAQGAATPLMLALGQSKEPSGTYFADNKPKRAADWAVDKEAAERLWAMASEQTGLPTG